MNQERRAVARLRHVATILEKVFNLANGRRSRRESDSQQPAALDLGKLWWLRGIKMELVFQSDGADCQNRR